MVESLWSWSTSTLKSRSVLSTSSVRRAARSASKSQANQLKVTGTSSAYATPTYYVYDKKGSLTNLVAPSGATYFAYNTAGLVARMRWADASATYFFYDGNLQRYAMVVAGTATYFLWDGPNLLQELNADGTVKEEHTNARTPIAGIGQLVETNRPGQTQQKIYPIMDPRGSITKYIQTDGATVFASREYDAFGNLIPNSPTGTWPGRFGFQGQAWQEIFSANGSQRILLSPRRVYDPATGRFLQNEWIPQLRSTSQYQYCSQNPTQTMDPFGLQDVPPPPGTSKIPQGSPRWNQLQPAIDNARQQVDAAIREIQAALANPDDACVQSGPLQDLQRYFGTQDPAQLSAILENYGAIQAYLNSDLSNRLYDDPAHSEDNRAFAVNEGTDNWGIGVQSNFPTGVEGSDSDAGIILHEMSHNALGTMDRYKNTRDYQLAVIAAQGVPSADDKKQILETWANQTPSLQFPQVGAGFAINEADSYKFFAEGAASRVAPPPVPPGQPSFWENWGAWSYDFMTGVQNSVYKFFKGNK